MGALLLALVAAMTPFVAEPDRVHAQGDANRNSLLSNLTLSVGKFAIATLTWKSLLRFTQPVRVESNRQD